MDAAALTALTAAAALGLGILGTWLTTRRTSSGKIGTTEAATLWDAAEKMRAEIAAQRDKAVEQRDRLMDSQTAQVLPALEKITGALGLISDALARIEARQQQQ